MSQSPHAESAKHSPTVQQSESVEQFGYRQVIYLVLLKSGLTAAKFGLPRARSS